MSNIRSQIRAFNSGVIGMSLLILAPFLFAANNPIEVSSLETQSPEILPFQPPVDDGPATEISVGESQYQMQILQQEVQQLRGIVEELSHALDSLRATQDDRYLELDSRLQGNGTTVDQNSEVESTAGTLPQDISSAGSDEKFLYESAIALIQSRQYDLAIEKLQAVIDQYPDGSLTPNAYYWLGEVYAAKPTPDYENARKALAQVITYFPENRKVPDAAFKLGKIYHLMGNCQRSVELLKQVIDSQKGKSVSKLAEAYLRDNVGNCE